MKIKNKILVAFLLILAVFAASGTYVIYSIGQIGGLEAEMQKQVRIMNEADGLYRGVTMKQFGAYIYIQGNKAVGSRMITDGEIMAASAMKELLILLTEPALVNECKSISALSDAISGYAYDIMVIYDGNSPLRSSMLAEKVVGLNLQIDEYSSRLTVFRDAISKNVDATVTASRSYSTQINYMTMGVLVAGIVGSVGIAYIMGDRISRPIKELTVVADKMSRGNLNQKIDISTGDEIEELGTSFKRMINAYKIMEAMNNPDAMDGTAGGLPGDDD